LKREKKGKKTNRSRPRGERGIEHGDLQRKRLYLPLPKGEKSASTGRGWLSFTVSQGDEGGEKLRRGKTFLFLKKGPSVYHPCKNKTKPNYAHREKKKKVLALKIKKITRGERFIILK